MSVGNSFSRAPHPLAIRLGIEASLQEMMKSPTADWDINRLNYWIDGCGQFTLVTDGFLYGDTLIEETVEDLLRWEDWLARSHGVDELDVAGIS